MSESKGHKWSTVSVLPETRRLLAELKKPEPGNPGGKETYDALIRRLLDDTERGDS